MIVELTVENLAIIERCKVGLQSGFTVFTGETGAGKSLFVDAIELALGERADSESVRSGQRSAVVDVRFDLSSSPEIVQRCSELGIVLEGSSLQVHREVFAEGRSQCRIGGKLTPVSTLRQLGQTLVDLHGQHDHQSLFDPERHIESLDAWIGLPAQERLAEIREIFAETAIAKRRLHDFRMGLRDREQRIDILEFQVREIEAIAPVVGEMEELEARLTRLKNTERLTAAAGAALEALAEREDCAVDLLGISIQNLDGGTRLDPDLEEIAGPLREALIQLQEGAHSLREYVELLEADPNTLEESAARIDALRRLRRKYGEDEAAVLAHLENSQQQLALLQDADAGEEQLVEAYDRLQCRLDDASEALSALRRERAIEFATLVQAELRGLAMDRALFEVAFRRRPADERGIDDLEFFFSANAGEPPRPLSKIASGGEISRVMLAIKAALAGRAGIPTLIFDEADSGIGGRAASAVAQKLAELAKHHQVLVISHLPQVAARATRHFRIEKVEIQGRMVTQVRGLTEDERIEELARMLAGETLTPASIANAREMLGITRPPASLFD